MTKVNAGTKKAEAMIWEWENCYKGNSVDEAYVSCSYKKQSSFEDIRLRACSTEGYNHDLKVTSAGSHFYSTMYSFTNDEGTFLVKDTASNTFILKL